MKEKSVRAMLFASPVSHSLSPLIHNTAFQGVELPYVYQTKEVNEQGLPAALSDLRESNLVGVNLSMPNKVRALSLVDELSPEAQAIGAINTIKNTNGKLVGYNTDGTGFVRSLTELEYPIKGHKAMILGCGGAGLSVIYALAKAEIKELIVLKRKNETFHAKVKELAALVQEFDVELTVIGFDDLPVIQKHCESIDFLVNTTSIGMGKGTAELPLPKSVRLAEQTLVYDLIYDPLETPFLAWAASQGCQTVNGLSMLVYQAAAAFEIWTSCPMPVNIVFNALANMNNHSTLKRKD